MNPFSLIPHSSNSTRITSLFICIPLLPVRLLTEPAQPLKPPDDSPPNTVPSFPVQTESELCRLDLSAELFGGVNAACGRNLDRSRCCPVLAAWLFAAHARSALQVNASAPPATDEMPMMPDDSQNCVNSLQNSLQSRNIHIPQPNASCDAVLCFCGIRLHQIGSLSCPAAFNVTKSSRNAIRPLLFGTWRKAAGIHRMLDVLDVLGLCKRSTVLTSHAIGLISLLCC
ncbi:putative SPARK domain-containing protein [Helianthus annuus]|nr:putative SPARK domain-containing protein [Helianthus annuus]